MSSGAGRRVDVTVVVAAKNGAATLQRCLDSVASQRGVLVETVVIDGGSSDATRSILEANGTRLAYWCSEPDSGIFAAWNKGTRRASGEWVCFLGCDDVLRGPRVLYDLVEAVAHSPRLHRVVYGRINLVTPDGTVAETVGVPWALARPRFLEGLMIPHPGTLHHRSVFEVHGAFDETYKIAGDYELLLRELLHGEALFVDSIVVDMRLGGISARPDTICKALEEVVRARRTHGLTDMPRRLRVARLASHAGAFVYATLGKRIFGDLADAYRLIRGKPRIWTV